MNTAQINIIADNQEQAEALAIAANNGLVQAGFTNVAQVSAVSSEPSFLDTVRGQFPDLFNAPVEISYATTDRGEAAADDTVAVEEAAEETAEA